MKRACWSAGSTVSPGGTRSSVQSVISIASRVSGPVRSSAIATIVWSTSAGASSYSPASQTVSSQWVVLPVTRMIQSASADSTLRKYPRPSIRRRSNVAPDRASAGRSSSRSVAPATSSSSDPATRGMSTSMTLLLVSLGAPA